MNLYALLTATRVCQILDNHGWPALTVNVEENGWMMTMKTTMTTDALVKLISAMIERGRIGKEAMAGLTLLCDKNLVEATISAEVCGRDISIEVNLSGIPESQCLCHDYLKMVMKMICGLSAATCGGMQKLFCCILVPVMRDLMFLNVRAGILSSQRKCCRNFLQCTAGRVAAAGMANRNSGI